jgi:monofunctional biosynthetic peptidoglycan transglycosylase
LKKIGKIIRRVLAFFFASTILITLAYRYIPVFATPLMFIRTFQQITSGEMPRWHHKWVTLDDMSPSMPVAVMASEDQRFLLHHGFDFNAIQQAAKHNKRSARKRGASTITQQTAKNVFLWPGRSWTRKGFEAYFTALIELFWGKHRIMEVYLNSIEMGDGIYGTYSVAKHNFGKDARDLTRGECALIAATLPNPRKFNSASPSSYMRVCQSKIEHQMKFIPSFPKEGEKINPNTVSGGVYSK